MDLEKNPKGYDYYANRLRRVASDEQFKGKLNFNVGAVSRQKLRCVSFEWEVPPAHCWGLRT